MMTRPPEKIGDPGETKPWEPPQRPDPKGGRMKGGGGGGNKNPPTTRNTRELPNDGGDGVARQGTTKSQVEETETAKGSDSSGHPPAHCIGAVEATSESNARPCCEYGKEATASLVGGQSSAGSEPDKDGHGSTGHGSAPW